MTFRIASKALAVRYYAARTTLRAPERYRFWVGDAGDGSQCAASAAWEFVIP